MKHQAIAGISTLSLSNIFFGRQSGLYHHDLGVDQDDLSNIFPGAILIALSKAGR